MFGMTDITTYLTGVVITVVLPGPQGRISKNLSFSTGLFSSAAN